METIIIPDPKAVAAFASEAMEGHLIGARFNESHQWILQYWTPNLELVSGYGDTPEAALEELMVSAANHDPLRREKELLQQAGYTVTKP